MIDGLPAVTGMRITTVAAALQNLAWVSNRVATSSDASNELLEQMRKVLDRFVDAGLPYDIGPDGGRRFDLVELRNFVLVADRRFDDPFWREHVMPLARRIILEAVADRECRYDEASFAAETWTLAPRQFRLRLIRSYNPRFLKKAQLCRLRLPVPLEDTGVTDLQVRLAAPGPGDIIRISRSAGRLDVTVDPAKVSEQVCDVTYDFVCDPKQCVVEGALDPRERAIALGSAESLIRLTPALRDLAQKIVGSQTDALGIVRVAWEYLHSTLNIGSLRHSEIDSADPLTSVLNLGWADCQLASAVLVGLCRSRGLPARIVGGFMLQRARPGYHYWAEVWIAGRGWLPFDTLGFAVTRPGDGSDWRDVFFGRVDYRARVECLPHIFAGLPSFQLPLAWHLNALHVAGAIRTRLEDSNSGEAVFSDDVSCEILQRDQSVAEI
jgi:transglutaminase-like putative cysteine protease